MRYYSCFPQVYELVRQIPEGQVASYGMVASLLKGVTSRMVGSAMAATEPKDNVPWWRVLNSAGKISLREGSERQQLALEEEGVGFSASGKISWKEVRWQGPADAWLEENAIEFIDFLDIQTRWPD